MNNEELILQILTDIKSDVTDLKSDVNTLKSDVNTLKSDVNILKSDVNTLKSDVNTLKSDVNTLKSEVKNINIHLENETDKNIHELIVVFTPKAQQFEDAFEKIGSLLFDMDNVKRVVISHSKAIQELQKGNS